MKIPLPTAIRLPCQRVPPLAAPCPRLQPFTRHSATGAGTETWPRLRVTCGGASWQSMCARKVRAKSPSDSPPPKSGVTPWHGPRGGGPPDQHWANRGAGMGEAGGKVLRGGREVSPSNVSRQFQPHLPKARRGSHGSPVAGNGMEKSFLAGQDHERVNSCCCELLFYFPVRFINKEHLETTAPIYPHVFHPLFQK